MASHKSLLLLLKQRESVLLKAKEEIHHSAMNKRLPMLLDMPIATGVDRTDFGLNLHGQRANIFGEGMRKVQWISAEKCHSQGLHLFHVEWSSVSWSPYGMKGNILFTAQDALSFGIGEEHCPTCAGRVVTYWGITFFSKKYSKKLCYLKESACAVCNFKSEEQPVEISPHFFLVQDCEQGNLGLIVDGEYKLLWSALKNKRLCPIAAIVHGRANVKIEYLAGSVNAPFPLKQHCRFVIRRKLLGKGFDEKTATLPLPKPLLEYLTNEIV